MKRDRLLINKELIPYRFSILLADELFELQINYNETADLFTVSLYKDNELVCAAEPLIYGEPLFKDVYMLDKYPNIDIVPIDNSGNETQVTWDNLGVTVFLEVDNCEESIGGEDNE